MKHLLLILFSSLLLINCKKPETPIAEIDKLPPATHTGANTFGCLLDGQAFIPAGGTNPIDCEYQFVNGGYYFALQGNKRDSANNSLFLALSTKNVQIFANQTYILKENIEGNAYGTYGFSAIFSRTNSIQTGELKITKLDTQNQIVSGTFWFDVKDHNGVIHQIRDGRFDMQYTQ